MRPPTATHTCMHVRYASEQGLDAHAAFVWLDVFCANLHAPCLGPKDMSHLADVISSCKQVCAACLHGLAYQASLLAWGVTACDGCLLQPTCLALDSPHCCH